MLSKSLYLFLLLLLFVFSGSNSTFASTPGLSFTLAKSDPTKPPGKRYDSVQKVKKIKLKLEALVEGEKSWVVINNHLIKPGQTVAGIKLLSIKNGKALVSYQHKQTWLKWTSGPVKTPVKVKHL